MSGSSSSSSLPVVAPPILERFRKEGSSKDLHVGAVRERVGQDAVVVGVHGAGHSQVGHIWVGAQSTDEARRPVLGHDYRVVVDLKRKETRDTRQREGGGGEDRVKESDKESLLK